MFKKRKTPNTLALLTTLPGQTIRLVKAEIGNAKEEVGGRIKHLVIGIVLFVVALIVLFWTIAVLLAAAVAGIAEALPVWLAALIVAGAGILFLAILVIVGIVLVKRGNPVPHDTINRIKSDIDKAREVKETTDQYKAQPGKKGTEPGKTGVWR